MDVITNATLLKMGVSSVRNLIQKQYGKKTYKPVQILDPLSTIIRLALLYFYEKGTKITISNNTIIYHPPGVLQGATRWSWGSKRDELHLLFKPLVRALKHFDAHEDKIIEKLFRYAVKGLRKLKRSYLDDNNVTIYSLNFYVHMIEKGPSDAELLSILDIEDDLNVFAPLWESSDIKLIAILFTKLCENVGSPKKQFHLAKAISHILDVKDERVRSIIQDTTAKI